MVTINLLPPAARRSKLPLKNLALFTLVFFITAVFGILILNTYKIWTLEKRLAALSQQYELLRPTQVSMELAADKQRLIKAKNAILLTITSEQMAWNAILFHFSMITPPQIWLSELRVEEKNMLFLKGNAATYPDLVTFITLLEQDELLTEPVLIKAEKETALLATTFEMTVKCKGI